MKLLALLALAIPLAVFAAPIDGEVAKKEANPDGFGNYGNYGKYGNYGSYQPPPGGYGSYPTPTGGYGSYGSYRRDAEPDAAPAAEPAPSE